MSQRISKFNARQTMNNREFEVFHYKDARPDGIMLHNHDFFEVYFFLGGEVEFQIENATYSLMRGDVLLVSPMELHRPIPKNRESVYERVVLWVDRQYLRLLVQDQQLDLAQCFDPHRAQHTNLLRLSKESLGVLTVLLDIMMREAGSGQYGSDVMRRCTLIQVLTLVNRLTQRQGNMCCGLASDGLVDRIYAHINRHICDDLSLEALSKAFYVDIGTLSRRFKKQLGTTIPEYVRHKRLTMARNLLLEGERPTEAAIKCGYADYSSFFRAFRGQYDTSPKEFARAVNAQNTQGA